LKERKENSKRGIYKDDEQRNRRKGNRKSRGYIRKEKQRTIGMERKDSKLTVGIVISLLSAFKSVACSSGILAGVNGLATHVLVGCEQPLVPLSVFAVLHFCLGLVYIVY
jgi:hypothetical protein